MKKNFLLAVFIFFSTAIFFSCQKEISESKNVNNSQENINKINYWLNQLTSSVGSQWRTRIQAVKDNLDLNKLWVEDLSDGEKFIITPFKNEAISSFNKEKKPVNYLVLIQDKSGKIRRGNIVQYSSINNGNKQMPVGTLYNFYNHKKIDQDFILTYLTVFDRPLYEFNYQKGAIKQFNLSEKKNKSIAGRTEELCIELYWQTYVNGILVSEIYLGTYCLPEVEEGGSGGSGGGGSGEELIPHYLWYDAYSEQGYNNCNPTISSQVEYKGKRVAGEPQGGHFTSFKHYDVSYAGLCPGMNFANVYFQAWHGTQTAYEAIQGYASYGPYIPPVYFNNTKNWMFVELFP